MKGASLMFSVSSLFLSTGAWREGDGPFYVNFCATGDEKAFGVHVLNGRGGAWPLDQFCQAVSSAEPSTGDYDFSLNLYNFKGTNYHNGSPASADFGHPGILFNAKDALNYDFVYFRPHLSSHCYQTGYVSNGVLTTTTSASCDGGPPKGRKWLHVKVRVRGPHSVSIYLDDRLITVRKMHFPPLRRGGALICNGYNNVVYFKNYTLTKIPRDPCDSQPCQNGGRCVSRGPSTFTCSCSSSYSGPLCQYEGQCGPEHKVAQHSISCLQQLWLGVGCKVSGSQSPDSTIISARQLQNWRKLTVALVRQDMSQIYMKAVESYKMNKRELRPSFEQCFGLLSDCKGWDERGPHTTLCMQQAWFTAGCATTGKAYPMNHATANGGWWDKQTVMIMLHDMSLFPVHHPALCFGD